MKLDANKRNWKATCRALLGALPVALLFVAGVLVFVPKVFSRERAGVDVPRSQLSSIKSVLQSFRPDCGRYPTDAEGLQALITAPAGLEGKWKAPYLNDVPPDPWGRPYSYHTSGADSFVVDCPATADHPDIREGVD